jgi:subtilisin family serine protease
VAPLAERGIAVRHLSRWLGAASALLTRAQAEELRRDPRVRAIAPVAEFVRPTEPVLPGGPRSPAALPGGPGTLRPSSPRDVDPQSLTGQDYDAAWEQLEMIGVPELHERGYSGDGVMVALFDGGYRKDHVSLAPLDLVAERDFVGGDDNVQYEPGEPNDVPEINNHGTYTWSTLGGYAPGRHMGAAYRATFVLARTEDLLREVHLEEDNYVAALEWADSLGVDLVSTSLGYRFFDEGPYPIEDLDGETLPITIATSIAADRGILVVTAMGNEGPGPSSLSAPADGKRVVAVGAVDFFGNVAGFSSRGPTGDGRTKPDVSAQGVFVACAAGTGVSSYARVNGTSLSTPLIAGLAALLIEARPGWTPDSVLAAMRGSGDTHEAPDNDRGWGVPHGMRALGLEPDPLSLVDLSWEEVAEEGDGLPAWGERGRIRVEIRNTSGEPVSDRTVRIASYDAGLTLLDSTTVNLLSIPAGETILTGPVATAELGAGPEAANLGVLVAIEGGAFLVERKGYLLVPEGAPDGPDGVAFLSPNPVRAAPVRISLHPAGSGAGALTIVTPAGRRVRTFAPADAGEDAYVWDLKDASGRDVPSGIYLVLQKGRSGRICVLR